MSESCGIRWFSDGSIDVKKNIHVSMKSYFSISNEMTFMIVFNMLYARDRHQLFELLCLQITSIIIAFREGIKEITHCKDGDDEFNKPEEFLNCMCILSFIYLIISVSVCLISKTFCYYMLWTNK
jgi:hypothetical protein